jgi:hypothetical protein
MGNRHEQGEDCGRSPGRANNHIRAAPIRGTKEIASTTYKVKGTVRYQASNTFAKMPILGPQIERHRTGSMLLLHWPAEQGVRYQGYKQLKSTTTVIAPAGNAFCRKWVNELDNTGEGKTLNVKDLGDAPGADSIQTQSPWMRNVRQQENTNKAHKSSNHRQYSSSLLFSNTTVTAKMMFPTKFGNSHQSHSFCLLFSPDGWYSVRKMCFQSSNHRYITCNNNASPWES